MFYLHMVFPKLLSTAMLYPSKIFSNQLTNFISEQKNQIRRVLKDALVVKYFKIFPSYYFWHRLYDVVADIMVTNYRQPQKHHIVI